MDVEGEAGIRRRKSIFGLAPGGAIKARIAINLGR
jgi:hypothetical protein